MKKYRTWSEINLKNLSDNIKNLRTQVGPDVKIMVVVKADAYGHGAVPISRTALGSGASMLGVGDSSEAIELRQGGILEPILVLGAVIEKIGWMISYNITRASIQWTCWNYSMKKPSARTSDLIFISRLIPE